MSVTPDPEIRYDTKSQLQPMTYGSLGHVCGAKKREILPIKGKVK